MDANYEYDAPKFYDFKRTDDGTSMASRWFDEHGEDVAGMRSPLSQIHNQATSKKAAEPLTNPPSKPSNLVKSWKPQHAETNNRGASHEQENNPRSQPPITRSIAHSKVETTKLPSIPSHGIVPAAAVAKVRRQSQRLSKKAMAGSKAAAASGASRHAHGLKMAAAVHKRALATSRQARTQAAAAGAGTGARPVARDRLKRVLQSRKPLPPARSTKPLTMPDDVELRTSKRARLHADGEAAQVVEPSGTPFKALALKVLDFQRKTPARFRSKPAPPPEHAPLSMTEPLAPCLMTACRTRPTVFKSKEELEMEEMEAMPKFHATKLNQSVLLGSGRLALDTAAREAPRVTEPAPFNFVTDDRAERRRHREQQQGRQEWEVQPAFKACPLDRSILEGPMFLPEKRRPRTSTIPKSPLLHTKLRSKETASLGLEEPRHEFHARPVPQYLQMPRDFMQEQQRTVPAVTQPIPFNLRTEKRGKAHEQTFKARIDSETVEAREARIPRAQPLPLSLDVPLVPPRPEPRGLTLPQPFKLRSEVLHQDYLEGLSKERRAEEEARRAEAEFKARPLPQMDCAFQVHESDQALTVPVDVEFATEARAAERAEFDRAVEEKARIAEERRRLEEAAQAAAEQQEVRKLRQSLVVPSRPVPDFSRPFMAMPSNRPLTNPVTPKLGKKKGGKRARDAE